MPRYTEDQLREMFDKADFSKDNQLFHNELLAFVKTLGITQNVSELMDRHDIDGDGSLQFNEFCDLVNALFP